MDISNLKMTLKAYQKVSPSTLGNYITKDDLELILKDYVTEAPADGNTYGRKGKDWTELKDSSIVNPILLYYGATQTLVVDYTILNQIADQNSITLDGTIQNYTVNINTNINSYIWFCSTQPIKRIVDPQTNWACDFIKQKNEVIDQNNNSFYCYRIELMLIPKNWEFILYY